MDRLIIAWNFRNWFTVVLMVAIGFSIVGLVVSFVRGALPGSSDNSVAQSATQ